MHLEMLNFCDYTTGSSSMCLLWELKPVLRIWIRDPVPFFSGSRIADPTIISKSLKPIFSWVKKMKKMQNVQQLWVKICFSKSGKLQKGEKTDLNNFFLPPHVFWDPGSGMGKNPDPGSGINIPDPQHWLKLYHCFCLVLCAQCLLFSVD